MSFDRFVVVGCGRSGTRYASEMFTRLGLRCAHQRVFKDTDVAPQWETYVGASSAFAAPLLELVRDNTLIIHQVRNPWRVSRSLVAARHIPGHGAPYYGQHVKGLDAYASFEEKAAHIWWQWNLLIERVATRSNYRFHRVEDFDVERVEHILKLLGHEMTEKQRQAFKDVETTVGSINPRAPIPDLRKMPRGFWNMVQRYNYEKPA